MLKTTHLSMAKDCWSSLRNLQISIDNAVSSCSDLTFGSDVRLEIQTILENTEKRIQRILDKNFAVKPKDFDKYHIITCLHNRFDVGKKDCRTLSEAKKLAREYYNSGCGSTAIISNHCTVWGINEQHPKGYDPRK